MNSNSQPVTVALPTLGCKANRYDSDALARALIARGYVIVPPRQSADIYIVNTCTVTGEADAKSRKALRRALKINEGAILIATGCSASLDPERLAAIEGLDAIVPITEQAGIPDLLLRLRPPNDSPSAETSCGLTASIERTRATVKIQDGCNLRCSFCAVTLARGPVRSRPIGEVLAELGSLSEKGIPEIVLTGIRLDAYGLDLQKQRLADLLDATRDLDILRLRLSSLEPIGITGRLIDSMAAHPKFCRHFHICLQSGDDGILRSMRRGYSADRYRRIIGDIRRAMPDATFSTDVIVGFPGETEEALANTCALIEEIGFIKLHIFSYSPRPHTEAAGMPNQVSDSVKAERSARLFALEGELFRRYASPLIGAEVEVLVERTGPQGDGLTPQYLRVCAPFSRSSAGCLLRVMLTSAGEGSVIGKVR